MKFLIVDDDERVAQLLMRKLSDFGGCITARNGDEAIERFQEQFANGDPFQAVFMDIKMPGKDGHEVVRKLREIEASDPLSSLEPFKLVMVSAFSDSKNVCKSFFQGQADAFVPKAEIRDRLLPELRAIKLID